MKSKNKSTIKIHHVDTKSRVSVPFANDGIKAGFPSPAQDYMDSSIDLNQELIKHPASTFCGRVSGFSLQDACIEDGDILVIDKSLEARTGDLAVCYIDGDFTLKYIKIEKNVIWLLPANPDFQPIKVTEDNSFMIWGIVTYTIRNHRVARKKR